MSRTAGLVFVTLIRICATAAAADMAARSMDVAKEPYRGWPNTYRLSNGLIETRVVTDVGPRIMDLRPSGGTNLLHQREAPGGSNEDHYMFRGGWRLWVAPERPDTTYALDNSACTAEVRDGSVWVVAPPQPAAGIQKTIAVSLPAGEPRLRLTSYIKNVSSQPLTYAAWSLPMLEPGGRAFIPLDVGPLTAFDATRRLILWSYAHMQDPRYQLGDRLVQIDHAQVKPAAPSPSGRRDDESKIGVDSTQGWAAYLLNGTLFLERFRHEATGPYPDGGATIEVYSNSEFLELEHLGPLTTIKPGEEIVMREDWWLFPIVTVPLAESEALETLQRYLSKAPPP